MTSHDHRTADGSSRTAVLGVLRRDGGLLRVEDLAEADNLSLSAVRFHLDRLVADGMVRTAKEPRLTPGRPRVMYQAVPVEAVDDRAAYRRLAAVLAAELAAEGGRPAGEAAGRAWARRLVAEREQLPVPVSRTGGPVPVPNRPPLPADAPQALAIVLAVLEDGGFCPRVVGDGWRVELHRCPFSELMADHSEIVCSVHAGLLGAVPELAGAPERLVLDPAPSMNHPCTVSFHR